jgi:hypothetical protein
VDRPASNSVFGRGRKRALNDYLPPISTGSLREPTQTTRGSTLTTKSTSDGEGGTPSWHAPSADVALQCPAPTREFVADRKDVVSRPWRGAGTDRA